MPAPAAHVHNSTISWLDFPDSQQVNPVDFFFILSASWGSIPFPNLTPTPGFSCATLPLTTELQELLVEISAYEMRQLFMTEEAGLS